MPPRRSNTLTEAELRLMRLLWRCGECSVQDLVSAMPEDGRLAYNSVLTTIRILESKGYVDHRQDGRAFIYTAVVLEQHAQQHEVRHVISRFFGDRRREHRRAGAPEAGDRSCGSCAKDKGRGGQLTVHSLIAHLTAVTVAGLWQGAALALVAAALLHLMPRASASLRHTLLVAIFAITAVLPWLHLGAAHFGIGDTAQRSFSVAPWVAGAVSAVWLALACIRATSLVFAWRRLRTVSREAVPVVLEGVDGFRAGSRRAQLCTSLHVDSPTIIGFREPRLLLPQWMAPLLSADDLRQIALHECEHLRRRDDWLNLLLQIGLVLSPLNPALVWLDSRIGVQRELACDAAVVASTAQPIAYATCLTRLAEQRMYRNRLALAMAAWGKQSELGQRVHALLSQTRAWTQGQSRFAACATAVALAAGTFGLARTPIFVSVAAAPHEISSTATDTASPNHLTMENAMPSGLRAVPASFVLKPVSTSRRAVHSRRHSSFVSLPAIERLPVASVSRATERPRLLRTMAYPSRHAQRRYAEYDGADLSRAESNGTTNGTAIRFMTTEFSTPYVAVPVANGWLIIQL